jgi:hypothetical protein
MIAALAAASDLAFTIRREGEDICFKRQATPP